MEDPLIWVIRSCWWRAGKGRIIDKYCKKLGSTRNVGFFPPVSCVHKISAKQLLLKYPVWTLNVELKWKEVRICPVRWFQ